jgi:uncharacterized delta-60 repeat protein
MTRSFSTHRLATPKPRRTFRPQAEGLEGRQLLTAGALDTTFNSTGYALPGPRWATAAQIQPLNGDILAAGEDANGSAANFRVVALTPSGAPDLSFGSNGSVTTDFAGKEDRVRDMAVMPDHRIVVVGWADMGTGKVKGLQVYNFDIAVARYLPNGALDTSFNGTGKVTTNISTYSSTGPDNEQDGAYAVVVQDDGKIVVGGYSVTGPGTYEGVLVRYNTDGTIDTTFDPSGPMPGVVQINLPNFNDDEVSDVAILRDPNPANDKIVTDESAWAVDPSGNSHLSLSVARYNLDGSLDTSFGTNGLTVTTMSGNIGGKRMALQLDGSVVVGGSYTPPSGAPNELALFRYFGALTTINGVTYPAGAPDPTFGTGGVVIYNDPTLASDAGNSVAIQPNGEILLAGESGTTSPQESILARFQTNGAIDMSFANNGVARNYFTNAGGYFNDVTLQPDGKIVAVGLASTTSGKTGTNNFLIARFLGDSTTTAATASPAILAQPTSLGSLDATVLIPLAPGSDQDLGQLAIGLIQPGTKRSRSASHPVSWLDDQRFS